MEHSVRILIHSWYISEEGVIDNRDGFYWNFLLFKSLCENLSWRHEVLIVEYVLHNLFSFFQFLGYTHFLALEVILAIHYDYLNILGYWYLTSIEHEITCSRWVEWGRRKSDDFLTSQSQSFVALTSWTMYPIASSPSLSLPTRSTPSKTHAAP